MRTLTELWRLNGKRSWQIGIVDRFSPSGWIRRIGDWFVMASLTAINPAWLVMARASMRRGRDIAQLLSYLRFAWSGNGGPVTGAEVEEVKNATADRKKPKTETELKKLK